MSSRAMGEIVLLFSRPFSDGNGIFVGHHSYKLSGIGRALFLVTALIPAVNCGSSSAVSHDGSAGGGSVGSTGAAGTVGAAGTGGRGGAVGAAGAAGTGGGAGAGGAAGNPNQPVLGDATAGQEVFRMETFGNEGFWTDALQLPQGIVAAGLTPVAALKAGLSVDSDAIVAAFPAATVTTIMAELTTDLSAANAPILNDPKTTVASSTQTR
jgi:hypothetical protein